MIDAHHHLWDLSAVSYPWLMAQGVPRFFGNPARIQRDYLLEEFSADAGAQGITASVHIQVGAADGVSEAQWVQKIADQHPHWPMAQVVFVDLTADNVAAQLEKYATMSTVRGVRQIVWRAPNEDATTGTQSLLQNPKFLFGLQQLHQYNFSFDLQLIPELMADMADLIAQAPNTQFALCHAGSPHDRTAEGITHWAKSLTLLSDQENVTCKLSGLGMFEHHWTISSISGIVETCLDQFGAGRCMFGSNFPVDSLYSDYATLFDAYQQIVPNDLKKQLLNDTAKSFYQFDF